VVIGSAVRRAPLALPRIDLEAAFLYWGQRLQSNVPLSLTDDPDVDNSKGDELRTIINKEALIGSTVLDDAERV
jgi:hypothetical protein